MFANTSFVTRPFVLADLMDSKDSSWPVSAALMKCFIASSTSLGEIVKRVKKVLCVEKCKALLGAIIIMRKKKNGMRKLVD